MESKINIDLQVRDTDTFNFIFVRGFSSITRNIINSSAITKKLSNEELNNLLTLSL